MSLVGASLLLLQVVDIVIHAATNQFEPIRVAANVILVIWVLLGSRRNLGYAALGGYVALNAVFLAEAGIMNGGELRVMLLILLALSVIFSVALLARRQSTSNK